MSEDDDLPDVITDVVVPEHKVITLQTSLEEHAEDDLRYCDLLLQVNLAGITKISKLSQIPKMTDSFLNVLEKRRQLALKPTHAADRKNPKAFGYEPLD